MQSFLPEAGQNSLPCLLLKKKLAEAAAPALPANVEEKKNYVKLLVRQLRKVESVLAHIGVKYYFEVDFEDVVSVISPDNRVRKVPTQEPLPKASSTSYICADVFKKCLMKPMVRKCQYRRALRKEECDPFAYKKHFLAPIVKVSGMPEGVMFKHLSSYGVPKLQAIFANKANIKMELITPSAAEVNHTAVVHDIVVQDPAFCAPEAVQTAVVQDIVVAEDPSFCVPETLQTAVVQDMYSKELCKATPGISRTKAKNRAQNSVDSNRSTRCPGTL